MSLSLSLLYFGIYLKNGSGFKSFLLSCLIQSDLKQKYTTISKMGRYSQLGRIYVYKKITSVWKNIIEMKRGYVLKIGKTKYGL